MLLTYFQILKMKFLFVSFFSVISTQNLRLEIPTFTILLLFILHCDDHADNPANLSGAAKLY